MAYDFMMNFNGVANCVERLGQITQDIENRTNQLEGDSEAALQSWDGAAKAQYWQEKANWEAAIKEMRRILGTMGNGLNLIHDNTKKTEGNNVESMRGAGTPAAY